MNGKIILIALCCTCMQAAQASGSDAPRVTTNKRFARGATMAFARATFNGSNISERGLCYSTSPVPTVDDQCSTRSYSYDDNGTIYMIEGLQPATRYYMRPYARTRDGAVGYGDVIKFYTLPKGAITYNIRQDGDADAIARITSATDEAVTLWNNLTSIRGVNFNVGHNSGTPTADCSYGGYIRVGSNASYQRTGTLLHEMLHGVGVGTHSIWWNSNLRSNGDRGYWLGDRVTEVVRFLENSETAQLNGDATHMWPYGINGAHEDSGAKGLYYGCSLICQALGEDGLPPSGGFATPAYTFDQEDTVKYYLKNEDSSCGLYTSFLTEETGGQLSWKPASGSSSVSDSAAWYVTFDPSASLYLLRNAATGRYLSFQSNGFRTRAAVTPAAAERMQLMRGRIDAIEGKDYRGYYIISNNNTLTPPALTAATDGTVSTGSYDLSNAAAPQRWLILTGAEVSDIERSGIKGYQEALATMLAHARALLATPHEEDRKGSDDALSAAIAGAEAAGDADIATLSRLRTALYDACKTFLSGVSPSDVTAPFDITFYLQNPSFDDFEGWNDTPAHKYSCAEYYATDFNLNQTVSDMPKGIYQLRMQAFQRTGTASDSYRQHNGGSENITSYLYCNTSSTRIASIWSDARKESVGKGSESSHEGRYIPNDLESTAAYFALGLYDNALRVRLFKTGDLQIGLRSQSQPAQYWTAFGNVRLFYFGTKNPQTDGILSVETPGKTGNTVFDLQGRKLDSGSISRLKPGLYVINGQKVVIK